MSFFKNYLRLFLINFLALWLLGRLGWGVEFLNGYETMAITALVLTLLGALVKPLIKILLIPINLLTLGAFRWLINVITLWLVTLIVPQFKIAGFVFQGLDWNSLLIRSFFIPKFWAFVLVSFFISLVTSFVLWLIK
jgi:putative membrane protein